MIIDTTQTSIERQIVDSQFICTTDCCKDWKSNPAWRNVLLGFNCGLCGPFQGDFSKKSLDWKKGYYKGVKARNIAFDNLIDECLVKGKYLAAGESDDS